MDPIASVKEIAGLIRKAGDAELYRKIVDLQGEVVQLSQDLFEMTKERDELKNQLDVSEKMHFNPEEGVYYMEGDPAPHCPNCYETKKLTIHLKAGIKVVSGLRRDCPNCNQMFIRE